MNEDRSTVEKFPMNGKICASVYVYEKNLEEPSPQNVEDAQLVIELFKKLRCEIDSGDGQWSPDKMEEDSQGGEDVSSNDEMSDDEEQCASKRQFNSPKEHHNLVIVNQKAKDTADYLKEIASRNPDACCFILYFIVSHVGSKFMTLDSKNLEVFQLWKRIKKPNIPVIFFIQANLTEDADIGTVLLNSDKNNDNGPTISESANVLLVYLPNPGNLDTPVIKILGDELCKNLDILTSLTNVNNMLIEKKCRPTPKFSSTLIKPLYLTNGEPVGLPEKYSCGRKYLAYAFLFGRYESYLGLRALTHLIVGDEQSLKVLEELGVELQFCVDDGKMTKADFKRKLREILQNDDLDSCDGIFIIISSHGERDLLVYAYDACFTVEFILDELANCAKLKDKPKVIIRDACRGDLAESSKPYTVNNSKGEDGKDAPVQQDGSFKISRPCMDDTLIALASVEEKMAYGNGGEGSVFIQNLCQTLRDHGDLDFQTVLTETINRVSLLATDTKQQATFTSALRKLLYFPKKKCQ